MFFAYEAQRRDEALAAEVHALHVEVQHLAESQVASARTTCQLDPIQAAALSRRMDLCEGAPSGHAPAAPAPAASGEAASGPEPAPSPEQQAAIDQANDAVDSALRRGRLAPSDVLSIRKSLALAGSPEAAHEVRQRVVVAINQNKLLPENPRFAVP